MYRIIFFIVVTGMLLSACGQKGPLYLPDDTQSNAAHHIS